MQLVIHAPFGGRINRAWGLALRKRFCRSFDFELQAAATDDGVLLSLGPQHSFPLETVFEFLHPSGHRGGAGPGRAPGADVRHALALERHPRARAAPLAGRASACRPISSACAREDLLAAVFPAQVACQDNHGGRSPSRSRTIRSCARRCATASARRWTSTGLRAVLAAHPRGAHPARRPRHARAVASSPTRSSTPIPYAFLDDAPLEERRARAVTLRRGLPAAVADDSAASTPTPSPRWWRRRGPICATPTSCTICCSTWARCPSAKPRRVDRLSRRADRGPARGPAPRRRPRLLGRGGAALARRHRLAAPSASSPTWSSPPRVAPPPGPIAKARWSSWCAPGSALVGPTTAAALADGPRALPRRGGRGAGRGGGGGRRAPRALHARGGRRRGRGVVRAAAARAHPSPDPRRAAPPDRARVRRGAHALPALLAARAPGDPAARARTGSCA